PPRWPAVSRTRSAAQRRQEKRQEDAASYRPPEMVFVSWQIDYNRRVPESPLERNFIKKIGPMTIKNKEPPPGNHAIDRPGRKLVRRRRASSVTAIAAALSTGRGPRPGRPQKVGA